MKSLFVSVVGQDDNIGDSLLRRGMLDAVRSSDIQLHLFIGSASAGYQSGLGIRPEDVVYQNRDAWLRSLSVFRGRGATSFLANAGEIIEMRGPRYLGRRQIGAVLKQKANGGALLQTGAGVRDVSSNRVLASMSVLRFFDLVTWRDSASRDYTSIGAVAPDWAFALESEPDDGERPRDVVAVSVRGDRAAPDESWYAAVSAAARRYGLEIIVLAQVKRDAPRARSIASSLNADFLDWVSDDHREQEERVRAVYARSLVTVSDRLHSLILGALEGSYPLGMPPQRSPKLARTLAPVSSRMPLAAGALSEPEIEALPDAEKLVVDVHQATEGARSQLAALGAKMRALVVER